jgi:hypothetical protein
MGAVNGKGKKSDTTSPVYQPHRNPNVNRQKMEKMDFLKDPIVSFRKIRNINTIVYTLFALKLKFNENYIPFELLSEILLSMVIHPIFPKSRPSTKGCNFNYGVNGADLHKVVVVGHGGGIDR